jgi:hypothetical protein
VRDCDYILCGAGTEVAVVKDEECGLGVYIYSNTVNRKLRQFVPMANIASIMYEDTEL